MDGDFILAFGLTLGIGIALLAYARYLMAGHMRWMYLMSAAVMYIVGHTYAVVPLGMGFILLAITVLIFPVGPIRDYVAIFTMGPCLIAAIVFIAWQPRFLKPWWLIWLEDNYAPDLCQILLDYAWQTVFEFERRTPDEASLAIWAEEVLDKLEIER